MKRTMYLMFAAVLVNALQAKQILIDLNDTSIYVSRGLAMTKMLADPTFTSAFGMYCIEQKQNPITTYKACQNRAFEVLFEYGKQQTDVLPAAYSGHKLLPGLLVDMLKGTYSEAVGQMHGRLAIQAFDKAGKFSSKNEKIVICKIIHLMFCSKTLASLMKPYDDLIDALEELSKQKDPKTGKNHQIIILSNMQSEVFKEMQKQQSLKRLFKLVPLNQWVISGDIKKIKPHSDIFEYVFTTFNTTPQECVFIDDQPENIRAASALGIKSILCTNDRPSGDIKGILYAKDRSLVIKRLKEVVLNH